MIVVKKSARLRHQAFHCLKEKEKNKAYKNQNKQKFSVAKKARYYLNEPQADKKELYVKNSIALNSN